MILYICEKPSQAQDIARHLKATHRCDGYLEGNGYQVTWGFGHLLALAPPEHYKPDLKPWRIEKLPVIPDKWEKVILPKAKKQFNVIKALLKTTHHVIVASDPDREGEVISREILDKCHYQGKIERLWLSALDDASIQKALKNIKPGKETENLYYAGLARAQSDFAIGVNLTMAASVLYGVNSVLSIGRVQTPTLKLVVDRDRAIENFKAKHYFTLKAVFESNKESFITTWKIPKNLLNEDGYCTDRKIIENIVAKIDDEPGMVKVFQEHQKQQKAPLCFSLSVLQKKASALFGYSAKQVLELAQALYEKHKATTYPRTDCGYLPEDQFTESRAVCEAILQADHSLESLMKICDIHFKSSVWNDKKITAHHAIIPTLNQMVDINKMSEEEFNLYDLIRRQYLAQFMGDYDYVQRQVEIGCAGEVFTATGHLPKKQGWRQAFKQMADEGLEDQEENIELPLLKQNQTVLNKENIIESKQTKPMPRFTEGTLIEAMKTVGKLVEDETLKKILKDSSGIGTEATRANILEVLFKRDYLQRKAKQVISTDKGRALIDLVPDMVKNPILTAQWEQQLDLVAEGKVRREDFVSSQITLLHAMLDEIQKDKALHTPAILQLQSDTKNGKVYLCPVCQSPLRRLKNKKGNYFWGCGKFPDCKFTTWEKDNKPSL